MVIRIRREESEKTAREKAMMRSDEVLNAQQAAELLCAHVETIRRMAHGESVSSMYVD